MKVSSEFSKYASHYGSHNIIQSRVAEHLLQKLSYKPQNILDLGCGSGALCKIVSWEYQQFTAVDFALGMLELHPKSEKINSMLGDFNDEKLFTKLASSRYDYIFSSSALQWAKDLDMVFKNLQLLNAPVAFAIFTANTFKTLNERASLEPLLRTADEIYALQKKYFNAEFEIVNYKLEFASTREMFQYIKQSGVSGSRRVLNYKQTKKLMNEYPLNYLEFEVVFITS